MTSNLIRIGIIGMGASGTTVATLLLHEMIKSTSDLRFELLCFEGKNEIGPGLAYSTPKEFHILNMASKTMSLFKEAPDDFDHWLKNESQYVPESWEFVPRFLFGRYLKERFRKFQERAVGKVQVTLIPEEVLNCSETPVGVTIATKNLTTRCDEVVLCLGHVPKVSDHTLLPVLERTLTDPWDFHRYGEIPQGATIGVLGTGLTAVDVALTLTQRDPSCKVYAFARKRQLPKVKDSTAPVTLKHLTHETFLKLSENRTRPISLQTFIDLLEKDFNEFPQGAQLWQEFYWDPPRNSAEALELGLAPRPEGVVTWHAILDATSELVPYLWNQMSEEDRGHFRVTYEQKWHMFRHSMPQVNAKKMYQLIQNKQLEVVTGQVKIEFDSSRERFQLTVKNPLEPDSAPKVYETDYMVDSRGVTTEKLELADSELLRNMQASGQLVTAPLGGVDVDFDHSLLKFNNGTHSHRMRMIGELTRGVFFYTNSYEMNRNSARGIVGDLMTKYQRT